MGIGISIKDNAARTVSDNQTVLDDDGPERLVAARDRLALHARRLGDEMPLRLAERSRRRRQDESGDPASHTGNERPPIRVVHPLPSQVGRSYDTR